MWIRFNLLCNKDTQRKLHKIFRSYFKDWERSKLVTGAVSTYHYKIPSVPSDSLYVCLNIPSVKPPHERSVVLTEETIHQIPLDIMNKISQVCNETRIEFGMMDYEQDIIEGKSWRYYRNAPTEEILRFASIGTKIAFDLLDKIENKEITLTDSMDYKKLALTIFSRLKEELGDNYVWFPEAFHFVCNPMQLNDQYLWNLAVM